MYMDMGMDACMDMDMQMGFLEEFFTAIKVL